MPPSFRTPSSTLPAPKKGFGPGRVVAIAFGAIFALAGIAALIGAVVLGWANATQRDSQGYFSSSTQRFSTSTYAITSDRLDLGSQAAPSEWFADNDHVASVRIRAKADSNVFVGIGRQSDVDRFLNGVAHAEVTNVNYRPFSVKYRLSPGTLQPKTPASEAFWVAKAAGSGTQSLTWAIKQGAWAVVIMNPAATSGVNADIALGLRVPFVGQIIGALAIGGFAALLIGLTLIIVGLRPSGGGSAPRTVSDGSGNSGGIAVSSREEDWQPTSSLPAETHFISPLLERP